MKKRAGFTLFELAITFAIGLILAGAAVIISVNFIKNRQIEMARETLVSYLRAAEQRALASEGNVAHGVSMTGDNLTLFRGASYAARLTAYDTILPYPSYITVSGISEVVFAKQTGTPSSSGTMTISNGLRSAVITIYSTGSISQ